MMGFLVETFSNLKHLAEFVPEPLTVYHTFRAASEITASMGTTIQLLIFLIQTTLKQKLPVGFVLSAAPAIQ